MESKFEYYSRLEDEIIRTYREAEDDETSGCLSTTQTRPSS